MANASLPGTLASFEHATNKDQEGGGPVGFENQIAMVGGTLKKGLTLPIVMVPLTRVQAVALDDAPWLLILVHQLVRKNPAFTPGKHHHQCYQRLVQKVKNDIKEAVADAHKFHPSGVDFLKLCQQCETKSSEDALALGWTSASSSSASSEDAAPRAKKRKVGNSLRGRTMCPITLRGEQFRACVSPGVTYIQASMMSMKALLRLLTSYADDFTENVAAKNMAF
jgi:hypothetical protein